MRQVTVEFSSEPMSAFLRDSMTIARMRLARALGAVCQRSRTRPPRRAVSARPRPRGRASRWVPGEERSPTPEGSPRVRTRSTGRACNEPLLAQKPVQIGFSLQLSSWRLITQHTPLSFTWSVGTPAIGREIVTRNRDYHPARGVLRSAAATRPHPRCSRRFRLH